MELGIHADTEKLHPGPGSLDGSHPHQKALQPHCPPGHACPWEKSCGQRNKECENAGGDSSAFRPNVRFHHERKIRASHRETILFTKVKMGRKVYFCLVFAFLFFKSLFCWRIVGLQCCSSFRSEKAVAPHSSTLTGKIPWTEEPGGLQSMGSLPVRHDWATSLSLFTFMHWRRKWQPTPVFLPGESQGWGAWWAAVYGVTQSRTRLKRLSSSSSSNSSFRYTAKLFIYMCIYVCVCVCVYIYTHMHMYMYSFSNSFPL